MGCGVRLGEGFISLELCDELEIVVSVNILSFFLMLTSLPATTRGTFKGAFCVYLAKASSRPLRSGVPGI